MFAAISSKTIRIPKVYFAAPIVLIITLTIWHIKSKTYTHIRFHPFPSPPPTKSPYYSQWNESRYYTWDTPAFFPPLRKEAGDNGTDVDYCRGFPTNLLNDIQIVVKTGAGELDRITAHLNTVTSCISNALIFSDLEQTVGNHHFIDVLADLPASYAENPDMAVYTTQKETFAKEGSVPHSREGWKLDRFKFLPMVEKAHAMRPMAKWYVFVEADVYYFWDTLFRLLDQLDPNHMHYLGSQVAGAHGMYFAYGGAGFVLSQGLVKRFVGTDPSSRPSVRHEKSVKTDCCGDAALGYAILRDTGVRIEALYPTFTGDDIEGMRVNEEWWCVPLLSMHRMTPDSLKWIWEWERTRPYNENPFVLSSMLSYTQSDRREGPTREFWDNFSGDERPDDSETHASAEKCGAACVANSTCLQYSYFEKKCKFGSYIQKGRQVTDRGEFISGWDMEKMASLGFKLDADYSDSCKDATWLRPEILKLE